MTPETRLVDNANFHVWTDALHARELARRAKDPWNRGTYVRWCVESAWTAFEMACKDALQAPRLGPDFWSALDDAVAAARLSALDRSRGIWSKVALTHGRRRDYAHPGIDQAVLFASINHAEEAIAVLRDGIKSIYVHARKPAPTWVEADVDTGYPGVDVIHDVLVHGGVTRETPNMIRVAHVYRGEEHDREWMPPGADWKPVVDKFIAELRVPVSRVVVYEGPNLVFSRDLPIRGSF